MSDAYEFKMPEVKKSRDWIWVVLALGVFFFLVIVLPWAILGSMGRSALRKQMSLLEEAGEPLSLVEYEARRPEIPDEQNSALIILALSAELKDLMRQTAKHRDLPFLGRRGELPNRSDPWPAERIALVEEFVSTHEELLRKIDVIHDMPRGRFPLDLNAPPMDISLPKLAPLRTAAKLEALAALRDSFRGDTESAIRRLQTALNLSAATREDPLLVSALVSISIEAIAIHSIQNSLALGRASPDTLSSTQKLLRDHDQNNAMPVGLAGERLTQMSLFDFVRANGLESILTGYGSQVPKIPRGLNWAMGGFIRLNQARSMELFAPLIDALHEHRSALDAASELEAKLAILPKQYLITRILMPSLSRSVLLWARISAELRSAQAALAAERFRLEEGRWPGNLKELVPVYLDAVPVDPFDGNPLRYRILPDGLVIYSVHEDGIDDGGKLEAVEEDDVELPDIGFRLWNVESRGPRVADP